MKQIKGIIELHINVVRNNNQNQTFSSERLNGLNHDTGQSHHKWQLFRHGCKCEYRKHDSLSQSFELVFVTSPSGFRRLILLVLSPMLQVNITCHNLAGIIAHDTILHVNS